MTAVEKIRASIASGNRIVEKGFHPTELDAIRHGVSLTELIEYVEHLDSLIEKLP